jgi:hypothetical protein
MKGGGILLILQYIKKSYFTVARTISSEKPVLWAPD